MDQLVPIPSLDDILNAPRDAVAPMIADLRRDKRLSTLVHDLNIRVLTGEATQKERARRALETLGFVPS